MVRHQVLIKASRKSKRVAGDANRPRQGAQAYYHHLYYFWTVAREGTIARACARLHLTQPTISGQLRALESSLDAKLFQRAGRHLVLTDVGQIAFRYADEIFTTGRELQDTGSSPSTPWTWFCPMRR
jgi:hypothetical protein